MSSPDQGEEQACPQEKPQARKPGTFTKNDPRILRGERRAAGKAAAQKESATGEGDPSSADSSAHPPASSTGTGPSPGTSRSLVDTRTDAQVMRAVYDQPAYKDAGYREKAMRELLKDEGRAKFYDRLTRLEGPPATVPPARPDQTEPATAPTPTAPPPPDEGSERAKELYRDLLRRIRLRAGLPPTTFG